MDNRGSFGSRLGVVLASAGSAVGLGNIWRFPTEVGRNGGAAFILVYLLCVALLAMPVMVSEFVIGRASRANTVHSYRILAPGKPWVLTGFMGVLAGILILSFYSVVAGWTLNYTIESFGGQLIGAQDFSAHFADFSSSPIRPLLFVYAFLLLTHFVVSRGVRDGIERYSKLMMPLLFIILLLLVGLSLSMSGTSQGLTFLLRPDFSRITGSVVLSAMGQAFFSLSLAMGCLCTYASYFSPETNLPKTVFSVCAIDTFVAVLSGFIIFPAVYSVEGATVDAGPGLVFQTLPNVFNIAFHSVPVVGYIFSSLFYMLLILAALTSAMSLHEPVTAYLLEVTRMSRRAAATWVSCGCVALSCLCALSFGLLSDCRLFGMTIFDLFDFISSKFILPMGGIIISLFVGWYLDRRMVESEVTNGGRLRFRFFKAYIFLVRYVVPVAIASVFVHELISK